MRGTVTEVLAHLQTMLPDVAKREHIKIAREGLDRVRSKSPGVPYRIIVDGKPALTEDGVKPFGVIKYVFIRLSQVARYAMQTAVDLSPVLSGRFKHSWQFIADGVVVGEGQIKGNEKRLVLVNFQPYARKLNVRREYGTSRVPVPPGIVEKVRQLTSRKFGQQVNLNIEFIELRGGYVLKHNYVQTMAKHGRNRVHTEAGRQITYPALIITPKD